MTPAKRSDKEPEVTNSPRLKMENGSGIRLVGKGLPIRGSHYLNIPRKVALPKWIERSMYSFTYTETEKELEAFKIAWAALDYYGSFEKDEGYVGEARKAQRAIRRLGR